MMRFLVVGCGGSGGYTLAYLMDQLRSDLRKDGVGKLPAGWQFVFVDVPVAIQPGPKGVKNVVEQDLGAHYQGLGTFDGSYAVLDKSLTQTLLPNYGLGAFGAWACRRPNDEETSIGVGAGQYRAIGRAILLSKADQVRDALRTSYQLLSHDDTLSEMEQVARATQQSFDATKPPLVLVVSSMAGGAGASMALDVCRLLTYVPNVDPGLIALFMVTPDVFDTLPEQSRSGVRANALAMLGEIVASQTGAARRHDVEMLNAVGVADPADVRVPFARVFPVGRTVGLNRAVFGDGSKEEVYRGLARGLAGLMTSEVASDQFIDFDLGNRGYVPARPALFGWGAAQAPLPWGSFGFASISMGRDRYAEYAAQRIARACVDRLVRGHLDPRGRNSRDKDGTDQAKTLLDLEWSAASDRLGLPTALVGKTAATELNNWYTTIAMPQRDVLAAADQIVDQVVALETPYVNQPSHWLEHVRRGLEQRKPQATQRADDEAYRLSVNWLQALLGRLESELADGIARHGLVFAGVLLDRVQDLIRTALIPGTEAMSHTPSGELTELPAEVSSVVRASRHGEIVGGDALLLRVRTEARNKLAGQIYAKTARHVSRGLAEFATGGLTPLRRAVSEAYVAARHARQAELGQDGLAELETDQYGAWPSETDVSVPARFGEANNELMLTPSSEFSVQFKDDLDVCLPAEERGLNVLAEVVTQVISGVWRTVGAPSPGGLLIRRAQWWPRGFPRDPATDRSVRSQDADFDLTVRPRDLRLRAMQFVQRSDASFDRFCSVSLRDYVLAEGESVNVRERRQTDMVDKLRRALRLALPLISVHGRAVDSLHGKQVQYRYKFSDIPLISPRSNIVEQLRGVLNHPTFDASTRENFNEALKDSGNPRRIDIFGSYPLFAPYAFNSILDPVIEQWEATPPEGRREFWNMRRSRTLDASLPMGDNERQAMIAGWFVGQIVGEIKRPGAPYEAPVQIWNPAARGWVNFPSPMLTPPSQFRSKHEWLPAVLESILLAVARAHRGDPMSSLKPYHLLRDLYDTNPEGGKDHKDVGLLPLSAEHRLRVWLQRGPANGLASAVGSIAKATDPESRYQAARAWLTGNTGPSEMARRHMPSDDDGQGGTVIADRAEAARVPLFRDLARDVAVVIGELTELLDRAHRTVDEEPLPAVGSTEPEPKRDDDIEAV